jgi:hypothetical protein
VNWRALQDRRDMAVALGTLAAGLVALGMALGERQERLRIRAEAECPAPGAYRRVMHINGSDITVRCFYREKS